MSGSSSNKHDAEEEAFDFYTACEAWVRANGYANEITWAESLRLSDLTPEKFMGEYLWTVINSGMKYEVARKIESKFADAGFDPNAIRHPMKRAAIIKAQKEYLKWFAKIKSMDDPKQIILFLDSLPHIGPITRYQLAQNIGIDVAKPDRWLVRAALRFGYSDVQKFCEDIAKRTGQRVRTVDLVIWRFTQANGVPKETEPKPASWKR